MMKRVVIWLTMMLLLLVGCTSLQKDQRTSWLQKATYGSNDYEHITDSINEFGFDYIYHSYIDEQENVFISPASMFIVLSAIYHAATDETKAEIAEVLHVNGLSSEEVMQGNAALLNGLYREMDDIDLQIANALWLTDQYSFNDDYIKDLNHYFSAGVEQTNLQSQETVKAINDWVEEWTGGKIKQLYNEPLGPEAVALLLNAIYFDGKWEEPFSEKQTEEDSFFTADNTEEKVAFMYAEGSYRYSETDTYQAIRIPYKDYELSMYVYLPREGIDLNDWVQDIGMDDWKAINKELASGDGELWLPKFSLDFELNWNEYLKQAGMESVFDEEKSQLGNLSSDIPYMWLSDVRQKLYIEVDEEGTKATVVSSGQIDGDMTLPPDGEPFSMKVDRPFLMTITDDQTDADLFIGVIANPNMK